MSTTFSFYEFFAGGGMARAGLGSDWECLFANDFDGKKGLTYQDNWGTGGELFVGDVRKVTADMLSNTADLAWGSFPCQDLSLAGGGAGLQGERSGTFYPFWDVMRGLISNERGPKVIALENVCGTLTSHRGGDFRAICQTFSDAGYRYGALVIDAELFLPHSRPRLFVVGVRKDIEIDPCLLSPGATIPFHTRGLQNAYARISESAKADWVWWNLPSPPLRTTTFSDIVEDHPADVKWHTSVETNRLLASMSPVNIAKVEAAKRAERRVVGGVYKRTRPDANGRVVRAEVRFDDIAGCLRTPNGGSSRQTILVVEGERVRSRLISARETARLMGLAESYRLPKKYNEAYHLTGDGVAVPVVRFLSHYLFEPLAIGRCVAETGSGKVTSVGR
ncbi:DNA (cytosine-5-)-methyltransferase [Agrobacterium sp. CCNWLW32]|jgi:DNA (cytosine-5)-methyltransferase 1|uniref:DNA cytosine methyltransferase n=1 Tax=Agrobacterium TaxID=357 RepID=UPI000DD035B7|nr:DNA (cytosine-5-)-methyltransferase [Agrobacterium tumefaciens]NTE64210.1 DNA cytosine methyltransferase [Agrobacterium tumefaciens]NUL16889.1 DNA cytosine methyltransferase [Agrobacterium tumefaciens]QNP80100.1 DNA cytosine methyltransferase [Agrobacterium tumefaciens]